jgi:hypothetical protein
MPPKSLASDVQVVGVDGVENLRRPSTRTATRRSPACRSTRRRRLWAPTGCVATINGTTLTSVSLTSAGGQATLLVSCATPSSGITYNWSKNGVLGASSSSSFNETCPANTTSIPITASYQVKACVGAACVTVPTIPLTVTVAGGGGGGGGGGGNPPPSTDGTEAATDSTRPSF